MFRLVDKHTLRGHTARQPRYWRAILHERSRAGQVLYSSPPKSKTGLLRALPQGASPYWTVDMARVGCMDTRCYRLQPQATHFPTNLFSEALWGGWGLEISFWSSMPGNIFQRFQQRSGSWTDKQCRKGRSRHAEKDCSADEREEATSKFASHRAMARAQLKHGQGDLTPISPLYMCCMSADT